MKALSIVSHGKLELKDIDEPKLSANHLRIGVEAMGLNRADLLQSLGRYPPPPGYPADIPGLEYAGIVLEVGDGVRKYRVGDSVMGIVAGGAWVQQLVLPENEVLPVPRGMSLTDAASIPEAFMTAFDAVALQAQLRPHDALLVHAAGSGVGVAAVQLGSALGALVMGTARSAAKLERAKPLGLKHAIVCETPVFAEAVKANSEGRGADVVLDLVGAPYFNESVKACALKGRIVLVGMTAGTTAEIDFTGVLYRRLTVIGTVLRSRPAAERAALAAEFEKQVLPMFAAGTLKPIVEAVHPASEVNQALNRLSSNETFGKLVLRWS